MDYDIIIIGGGPGGSEAAYHLANKGYKTLILEKGKKGRDKPCAGGIPPVGPKRVRRISKGYY